MKHERVPPDACARLRPRVARLLWSAALAAAAAQGPAAAQTVAAAHLADLSLEQLASIEVTSVSKRVQRLSEVPGSVYVIRQEDIRRSGATSLPEVLRLAPNLQVARADANQYAITARGFNGTLANKMLVLIDGRTVYSPLFSGVFWEAQGVMLEDVERIEVLSGSGGTLYGSNAVNGVINIITRSARETRGTLASAAVGNQGRVFNARHGAGAGEGTAWRVWGQRTLRDHSELTIGAPVRDGSGTSQAGFRADNSDARQQLTLQGDVYESTIDQAPSARRVSGLNLLGRWSRELGGGSRAQLQGYFDRTERDQPGAIRDALNTFDLEFQHLSQPWATHELLWGGGWRSQDDRVDNLNPAALVFLPAHRRLNLWNAFVQDDLALHDKLRLTVGLKLEHNTYTGAEVLPNVRLAWDVAPNHLVWAAASRAVRAPARIDRDVFTPALQAGGGNFQSEVARVFELGLRGQPAASLSYSLTLFQHRFDRLRSVDAGPGGTSLNNNLEGNVTGLEAWGTWRVSDHWRLKGGYVHQRARFNAVAGTAPLGGATTLGNDPRNRWSLGSSFDLGSQMEVDFQLRRVGALPAPAVPSYTALDARWGWQVRPDLELSLTARNLGGGRHPEWGAAASRAEYGRNVVLKAVWRL
ncbi:MAG: TonB-dependent receptor [Comamonadaceae bacterium]|nr:MAG: TonB-dependent receptor [Comamonadaceae bacterium]